MEGSGRLGGWDAWGPGKFSGLRNWRIGPKIIRLLFIDHVVVVAVVVVVVVVIV